jgi:hypothetical protein
MASLDEFRTALPHLRQADDETVIRYLQRNYAPKEDFDSFANAFGYKAPAAAELPKRSGLAAINDTVIEGANAVAGGIGSVASFVSPGNRVSSFIDENIIRPVRNRSPTARRRSTPSWHPTSRTPKAWVTR